METKIVSIDLDDRGYDIFIGLNLLTRINDFFPSEVKGKRVFIVTDVNVQPYAQSLREQILKVGAVFCEILVLPAGEKTKSFENFQKVQEWMLENNMQRKSLIMAVGGGVIGDLAGFTASTVLRGVPFLQIPTTLLSQVDSSVGGKTGINTAYGKNLVGSFYQPVGVVADIASLNTLPRRELLAGYAEIVKYGLLGDYDFFEWLEEYGDDVLALEPFAVSQAIETSCRAKAKIVAADEHEGGVRALLNLGHTFAHALEAVAGYDGTLLHGEAVSIGMVLAFDLSVRMELCPRDDYERVKKHLSTLGLPVDAKGMKTTAEELLEIMKRDKKVVGDKMTFILVRTIGDAFITQDVPANLVRDVLEDSL